MYYIYKIENLVNHKKYIGLTNNIARRRARHFTDLRGNRHDNSFLQKEFNIYGEENFCFNIEFQGDITSQEIGEKEKEYIKKYDSYRNGYNQNEGGNFGPSNGGSHLTQSDIFNILSAIEFCSRPGQILSDIYEVSKTTISRIKKGENHCQYKEEYDSLPLEERKAIYKIFCDSTNFYEQKVKKTIIQSKRKLNEFQVHLILCNFEFKIFTRKKMAEIVNVKSTYTLDCIKNGISYKDYALTYSQLTNEQKEQLVSLLSNQ
jgi:hypothetical protein